MCICSFCLTLAAQLISEQNRSLFLFLVFWSFFECRIGFSFFSCKNNFFEWRNNWKPLPNVKFYAESKKRGLGPLSCPEMTKKCVFSLFTWPQKSWEAIVFKPSDPVEFQDEITHSEIPMSLGWAFLKFHRNTLVRYRCI